MSANRWGTWFFRCTATRLFLVLLTGCCLTGCDLISRLIPQPEAPQLVGKIKTVTKQVAQGRNNGTPVLVIKENDMYAGDVIRVSQGGEGLITFPDVLTLSVFNDTELTFQELEKTEKTENAYNLVLIRGGFTGRFYADHGKLTIPTPDGAQVTITGTNFCVVYDAEEQALQVCNFDGSASVTAQGKTLEIKKEHYTIVKPGQAPEEQYPLRSTKAEVEDAFRRQGSPVKALENEFQPSSTPYLPATNTPPPTSTPTPTDTPTPTETATPTATATLVCPPELNVSASSAYCREGPGRNWSYRTRYYAGEVLQPFGYATFDGLWWKVPNTALGGTCWVSDAEVVVIGGTECMQPLPFPPTYTPVPSKTPIPTDTPVPPAPALIAPANGSHLACGGSEIDVTLQWSPVSAAVAYVYNIEEIDEMGVPTGYGHQTSQVTDTSVMVYAMCSSPYGYRWNVYAVDGGGAALPLSDTWTFYAGMSGMTTTP